MKAWLIVGLAGVATLAAILIVGSESKADFIIDERTSDELYDPYATFSGNVTFSGSFQMKGNDTFVSTTLSSQWTAQAWAAFVDRYNGVAVQNGMLYVDSDNDLFNGYAYVEQSAFWPNNCTVDTRWFIGTEIYGGVCAKTNMTPPYVFRNSTGDPESSGDPNPVGFAVSSHGYPNYGTAYDTTIRIQYQNLAGTMVTLRQISGHGCNWTLSVELAGGYWYGYAVSLDDGFDISARISTTLVFNNTNISMVGLGDCGQITGGNNDMNCYFDNFDMVNRSGTGFASSHIKNAWGSSITWINLTGENLNATVMYARSCDNQSELIASSWENVTGTLYAGNTMMNHTLSAPFEGSIIHLYIWLNYSLSKVNKITLGNDIRTATQLLTANGGTNLYETVADAINGTITNDAVKVYPGWYHNQIFINKNITLFGTNEHTARIWMNATDPWVDYNEMITIKHHPFEVIMYNLNLSSYNCIVSNLYPHNSGHSGHLTVVNCNLYHGWYPIYTNYANVTIQNNYINRKGDFSLYPSNKAVRVMYGNITDMSYNEVWGYGHAAYIQQGNAKIYNNLFHCYESDATWGYQDAGGITLYPWACNGTSYIYNNVLWNASWGISIEDPDIVYVHNNTIYESTVGLQVVQRGGGGHRERMQWDIFGGHAYIKDNIICGDISDRGLSIVGQLFCVAERNQVLFQNITGDSTRPAVYAGAQSVPGEYYPHYGKYYINDTYIKDCSMAYYSKSYSTTASISMALTRHNPTTGLPANPHAGDKHIATATANGWTIHHAYTCTADGTWVGATDYTPVVNAYIGVIAESNYFWFSGVSWSPYQTSNYGGIEIHLNNFTAIDMKGVYDPWGGAVPAFRIHSANMSSTYDNITIRHKTFGTYGLVLQQSWNAKINNIEITNFEYGVQQQFFQGMKICNMTLNNCVWGILNEPWWNANYETLHLRNYHLTRGWQPFYNLVMNNVTFSVDNRMADQTPQYDADHVLGYYNNYANITIIGFTGDRNTLFTANSKFIKILDDTRIKAIAGSTVDIDYGIYNLHHVTASGNPTDYMIPELINHLNVSTIQASRVVISNIAPEEARWICLYIDGVQRNDLLFRNDTNLTFYAEVGHEYELRDVSSLQALWDFIDDSGTLFGVNIGTLCTATIFITLGVLLSMVVIIVGAGAMKGIKSGARLGRGGRRWR